MVVAALIVSVLALIVSVGSAWYARTASAAGTKSAEQAERANDDTEARVQPFFTARRTIVTDPPTLSDWATFELTNQGGRALEVRADLPWDRHSANMGGDREWQLISSGTSVPFYLNMSAGQWSAYGIPSAEAVVRLQWTSATSTPGQQLVRLPRNVVR